MEGNINPVSENVNPKPKKCKYFAIIILLILIEIVILLGYFVFFKREVLEGIISSLDINKGVEIVDEDEIIEDIEDNDDQDSNNLDYRVTEWNTYTGEEMGFTFDFPATFYIGEKRYTLAAMQKSYYQQEITNCAYVGPVDGDNKAQIAVGYDPLDTINNYCFRSKVGMGKKKIDVVEIQIGSEMVEGRKLTYTGVDDEQSYINYFFYLDNPNMNADNYNYFGLQIEFYPEYEEIYLEPYLEALKTFEWL